MLRTSIPPYEARSSINRDRIRDGVRPRSGQPAIDPHIWQETPNYDVPALPQIAVRVRNGTVEVRSG